MHHLHDDPPDKDMLPETATNGFKYSVTATIETLRVDIHTSKASYKSANKYYNLQ
jgi:hypothetical protein